MREVPAMGLDVTSSGSKLFHDPVANQFRLSDFSVAVMDSAEFQRLRDLKQLGVAYQVFPGACHNRFEHSIGTAQLASKVVLKLAREQPELGLGPEDFKVVELAGLCHDLGHGPFSHVFDSEFLPRTAAYQRDPAVREWTHEEMSGRMLERAIDEGAGDLEDWERPVSRADVRRVMDLITGSKRPGEEKPFLFDIVANKRNSIDVDKFDYLARDCHYCGVKASCDFSRLLHFQRVIGDEICYRYSEYNNIWDLFQTRAALHRNVYTHKKAKAIEFMIVDALLEADEDLKIAERVLDPAAFLSLDDTIIKQIEFAPDSCSERMKKAKDLIKRLRTRKIYGYVNECWVPKDQLPGWVGRKIRPEDITAHQRGGGYDLKPQDIIVQNYKVDYTMGDENPLDHVRFWNDPGKGSFNMPTYQMSTMLPSAFMELKVRIFTRSKEPHVVKAASDAFEEWQRANFGRKIQPTETPLKRPRTQVNGVGAGGGFRSGDDGQPSSTRPRVDYLETGPVFPRVSQLPPNAPSPIQERTNDEQPEEDGATVPGGAPDDAAEDPLFNLGAGPHEQQESITFPGVEQGKNGGAGTGERSKSGAGGSTSGAHRSLNL